MIPTRLLCGFALSALTVLVSGCAGGYRDYGCGHVPYEYSPPPPMSYTGYEAPPTPIAASHLNPK